MRGAKIDPETGTIDGVDPLGPALPAAEEAHAVGAKQPLLRRHGEAIDGGSLHVSVNDAGRLRAVDQEEDVAPG
jgi:hypothetical protein